MKDNASVFKTIGASNHSDTERHPNDYYATEPIAMDLLLAEESFHHKVWECACGEGHLSRRLKAHGYEVISTDLIDRGYGRILDFFRINEKFDGDIITNPPYKCFDIQTQCYTKRGWLYYDQITLEDEVLSVNPDTLEVEWVGIEHIIIRDKAPTEKMYHFKHKKMDIMVTEGHRMFAFYKGNNSLVKRKGDLITSERIRSQHYIPRLGYSWQGSEQDVFILPQINGKRYAQPCIKEAITIKMDDWLRFFGIWLADGYCRHTKNIQSNPRKTVGIKQLKTRKDEIEKILDVLPFEYKEYNNDNRANPCINFEIHNEQLWSYLVQFGYSDEKFIPRDLKDLPARQLKILLDSYFQGDGSVYNKVGRTYRTVSKQLSEDIWEILLKLGYLAHITSSKYTTRSGNQRILYIINETPSSVYNRLTFPSNKNDSCICEYEGKVWCLQLKRNGVFLLRRNGMEFICGNCALEFVEHALELIGEKHKVAMFLKLTFLEGKKRRIFFEKNPPKTVYVCSGRINCARNGDFEKYESSAIAYAWFVWEKGYKGEPIIKWIN